MINLLPESDKKELRREYLRRKIVVIGFFVFVTVLTGIVLLVPVFWLLDFQEENYKEQLSFSEQRFSLSGSREIISDIKDLNFKLIAFAKNQKERKEISWIIEELVNMKPKNIKIKGFTYREGIEGDDNKGDEVTVRGFSDTRGDLLNFVEDLRGKEEFSGVSLPTSSLLTKGDVDFLIIIAINEFFHEK